jgi:hypothetical protein
MAFRNLIRYKGEWETATYLSTSETGGFNGTIIGIYAPSNE